MLTYVRSCARLIYMIEKLFFAKGNAKLGAGIAIFSLPAGHTCAGAKDCLSRADKQTGKITDGPNIKFRCYATSAECLFPNIRKSRWNNFDMLRHLSLNEMADLICLSLPNNIKLCRIHQSGDFFTQTYFDAWIEVARRNPHIIFYGYSKMLPFIVARKNQMPANFRLTASKGGRFDALIEKHNLKFAEVVFSVKEAKQKKLKIDHDDSLVWKDNGSFAILLHGTQPAKSIASKAWHLLKKTVGGYKADYFAHYKKNKTK